MEGILVVSVEANIREGSSEDSNVIAIVEAHTRLITTNKVDGFYYIPEYVGYIHESVVELVEGSIAESVTNTEVESILGSTTSTADNSSTSSLLTNNLNGIYGIPYQFMNTVDRRLTGTQFGRKYAEKIIGRMPLLFLSPGKQDFMSEFSSKDKKSVLSSLSEIISGREADLTNILSKDGRYYTFSFEYDSYFKYVNPMCRATAKLLGIADKRVNIGGYEEKLGIFDWSKVLNDSFSSYFVAQENIVFYMDATPSRSESFSNDTRESTLASTINGMSDTGKEIQFLLGNSALDTFTSGNQDAYNTAMSGIDSVIESFLGGAGVLGNIASGFTTVLSGGKLVFPELWSDSSRSSDSYDISLKFRSPDKDDLSIYLNNIVPYIHLVAMTAPHEIDCNSYSSPFLVRAFYKGTFNIDIGIITNLSSTMGKEGSWNDTGLPTEIDVSLTIKDLYSALTISNADVTERGSLTQFVKNTALIDYLGTLAGLNFSRPEVTRQLAIYSILAGGSIVNLPNTVFNSLEQGISNLLRRLY